MLVKSQGADVRYVNGIVIFGLGDAARRSFECEVEFLVFEIGNMKDLLGNFWSIVRNGEVREIRGDS